ncbi:SusC/RagA family TonB-linked outer membrane protein [Cesiribacter andamanensis]|uniref:Outer membrane receptor for ferrienterochelin and colicin n=1 Tax=Cesiribacter andamanensis AMV16 TaxID=1279009 RepID=M7N5I4_9BACT|nr:SusC/RagA family TonB-linked outer membrane protein [Cesiribacter andamanensis]EMR02552.1 Outer membrane receptor for ferrienterochelin and colicin [Cesiribacter andamanensis AMV16]
MMSRCILLIVFCFGSTLPALAQLQQVGGVVRDTKGETLPGVAIRVKGTTTGAVTNLQGQYSLQVSGPESVLIASFVGFQTQEILVGNRSVIDITLEESVEQLREVVVTALGIEKEKKSLGYSAQAISGDELVVARENNLINSLAGRVSGVQINQSGTGPGGTSKVVIRGFSSIAGANTPLYVVDGIPMANPQGGGGQFGGVDYGDGISNLNPDDIESIDILKGASATALYGSRGQNGVIMITTKKGRARKGIGVDFSSNLTLETPLVLPDFQNRFGRGSNGEYPLNNQGNFTDAIRGSWGPRALGQSELNGVPFVDWTGEQKPYTTYENNIRDFFRTGQTYTNAIGFSGGSETTQARVALSHLHTENILPNSNLDRLNLSLNISSQLSEKFSVEGKINYIKQNAFNRPNLTLSPDNPMNSLIQMPRSIDLNDLKDYRLPNGRPRVYTNAAAPDQWQNPYWAVNLNTNNDERDRIIGYVKLEYAFTDWLRMHVRSGTDYYNDFRQNRNATNTIYRITPDRSFYSEYYGRFEERNSDLLLVANKAFSERLSLTATAGGNLMQQKARSISTSAQGLNIPDFFVIQNALSTLTSEGASQKRIHSVYGSVQAAYNNYLFVEVSGRNDWSSALPPTAWSYFYPSISSSLVFTDLLDRDWGILSFGKLRASYAEVGNDTGPHQLDLNYFVNNLTHGGQTFGQISRTRPPIDLKPERTTALEAGLELGFLKNRIQADVTYYHAGTANQILAVPVSKPSGFETSIINAGLVTNQGIELSLRGSPVKTTGFSWETAVNFTRNRSRVEELAPNVEVYQIGGNYDQFGVRIQAEVGGQFGDIYADNAFLRDPQTGRRIIGSNGLPLRDPAGIRRIGNFQPDFLAGFSNAFTYKNFTASFLLDIRKGGDIFSFSNSVAAANGNARYTQYDRLEWYAGAGGYIAEGVTEGGAKNTIEVNPQAYWETVGGRASTYAEAFLYDGSFVKLREATLGYRLPERLLERTFLTTARLSLVGRNLFFLHKNTPGFDPEATFNAGNDQGIEAFAFPSTRSVGVNLNVTF